jgi:hypothetical protein
MFTPAWFAGYTLEYAVCCARCEPWFGKRVFFLFYSFLLLSPARGTIVLSSSVHMSASDSFHFSFFIFNLFVTPNLWFFPVL